DFLPADTVFEIPIGSGRFFTNVSPRTLRFDDIPADIQFDDPDLGVISMLDRSFMFEDISGDGMSSGLAYSRNILNGFFTGDPPGSNFITVTDSDPLSENELISLHVSDGFRVTATMTQDQRDKIGYFTKGRFALVGLSGDDEGE